MSLRFFIILRTNTNRNKQIQIVTFEGEQNVASSAYL